jgi:hypothetical protein
MTENNNFPHWVKRDPITFKLIWANLTELEFETQEEFDSNP